MRVAAVDVNLLSQPVGNPATLNRILTLNVNRAEPVVGLHGVSFMLGKDAENVSCGCVLNVPRVAGTWLSRRGLVT